MSYRWTEGHLRDANIVDEDEFNREYNNYKGMVNGGLDRDNLPADSVGEDHLKAGAFLIYDLSSPDDLMVQGLGTLSSSSAHSTWDDRLSGWVHNTAQKSSVTTQEGMLHIDFCCWFSLATNSACFPREPVGSSGHLVEQQLHREDEQALVLRG